MISIRPLTSADTPKYRTLRQEILASKDAKYFSDSFERERSLNDEQWAEWCSEKREHTILGAFDKEALVGIIMITGQGKESTTLAEMEAAWLQPQYRGLTGYRLYKAGLDWAKNRGGYEFVISCIRDTASASIRLCQALGYVYAYTIKDELWADASVADTKAYVISLAGASPAERTKLSEIDKAYIISLASQTLHAPMTEEAVNVAMPTYYRAGSAAINGQPIRPSRAAKAELSHALTALETIKGEISGLNISSSLIDDTPNPKVAIG